MVKTDTLNRCLTKWAAQFLPDDRRETTIFVDGKTIRSTLKMKNMSSPLHVISARICELGITLASETVDSRSNEIPSVQALLEKMDIAGCLVVADALNCQQKLLSQGKAIICWTQRATSAIWRRKSPGMSKIQHCAKPWTVSAKQRKNVAELNAERLMLPMIFHGYTERKSGKN